jgi:hypothetical protein
MVQLGEVNMLTKKVFTATSLTLAASMFLAGCTSPEPTKEPSTSTAAPAPTDVPVPLPTPSIDREAATRAAITQIIVRPDHLQFTDAAGVELRAVSYDADAGEFVDLFTDLMGAQPSVREGPAGNHNPPFTEYTWDGFRLRDDHERADRYQADMNIDVLFLAPELGPRRIGVATVQGFKPGDDLRWLAEYMDEPPSSNGEFNQVQAEHGPPIGEQQPGFAYSNAYSVTGQKLNGHDGSVIFAPWNFGVGHA